MPKRQRAAWWLAAAVSITLGFVLVLLGDHNGWFLVVLGAVYAGAMTATGRRLTAANPLLLRWGLVGITLLLVLAAVVVGLLK